MCAREFFSCGEVRVSVVTRHDKMRSVWLFAVIFGLARGQVVDVATDTPSIYYTEPTTAGRNDFRDLTELPGGRITGGLKILERSKSPYIVREDLFVERGGELVVEPGVEIRFAPMIGLTVRGVITAQVITIRLNTPPQTRWFSRYEGFFDCGFFFFISNENRKNSKRRFS